MLQLRAILSAQSEPLSDGVIPVLDVLQGVTREGATVNAVLQRGRERLFGNAVTM